MPNGQARSYFTYRHQPLFGLYWAFTLLLLLLLKLPFWALTASFWRPRPGWTLKRMLMVRLLRAGSSGMFSSAPVLHDAPEVVAARFKTEEDARKVGFAWVEAVSDALVLGEVRELAEANGVHPVRTAGYWYGKRGEGDVVGQKAEEGEKVIYHFHGGGYTMGSSHPSNTLMTPCFTGLLEHTPATRLFALDYRLSSAPPFASANPFPAALLDALAGYRYLTRTLGFSARNIILSGDSAGGSVAYTLARYFALHGTQLAPEFTPEIDGGRLPGGLLLLSPTVNWGAKMEGAAPDSSMVRNNASDFVHAVFESGYARRATLGRLLNEAEGSKSAQACAQLQAAEAWLSPGAPDVTIAPGTFKRFPKTCFVVGGAEMTLDPMCVLRERMEADLHDADRAKIVDEGVKGWIHWIEKEEATHDYLALTWHEPERTQALKEVGKWIAGL